MKNGTPDCFDSKKDVLRTIDFLKTQSFWYGKCKNYLHLQILGNRFFGAILYNALQSVCFQTTSNKKYDCDIP